MLIFPAIKLFVDFANDRILETFASGFSPKGDTKVVDGEIMERDVSRGCDSRNPVQVYIDEG